MSTIWPSPLLTLETSPPIACIFAEFESGTVNTAQQAYVCPDPGVLLSTDIVCFFNYTNNGGQDTTGPNNGLPYYSPGVGDKYWGAYASSGGKEHVMETVLRSGVTGTVVAADRTYSRFVNTTGSRWVAGTMVFRGAALPTGLGTPEISPRVAQVALTGNISALTATRTNTNKMAVAVEVIATATDTGLPGTDWTTLVASTKVISGASSVVRCSTSFFSATGTTTVPARVAAPTDMRGGVLFHLTPL